MVSISSCSSEVPSTIQITSIGGFTFTKVPSKVVWSITSRESEMDGSPIMQSLPGSSSPFYLLASFTSPMCPRDGKIAPTQSSPRMTTVSTQSREILAGSGFWARWRDWEMRASCIVLIWWPWKERSRIGAIRTKFRPSTPRRPDHVVFRTSAGRCKMGFARTMQGIWVRYGLNYQITLFRQKAKDWPKVFWISSNTIPVTTSELQGHKSGRRSRVGCSEGDTSRIWSKLQYLRTLTSLWSDLSVWKTPCPCQ